MESKVYKHHIPIPVSIANFYKSKKCKRFHILIEEQIKLRGGILYNENGPYLLFNKSLLKDIPKQNSHKLKVEIWPDDSKYGMEMPLIFEEALNQDEVAKSYFEQLSPGKKRNLIHLVEKVKSESLKLRNAILICRHLKVQKGKLDFKLLRESFQNYSA